MQGPSIHFEELSLKLGGNTILDAINFEVRQGSIHCIIGPNGGGKTSLIRSLLGQMPHEGTIRMRWQGKSRVIGYVPQALDFDRTLPLTVANFMAMIWQNRPVFSGNSAETKERIRSSLERVGMENKADYLFGGLSGGERQRILLAQALIPHPQLLVLDEPASGLDQKGAEIMHFILQEIKASGTTILMIHHDLKEVKKLCDQVTCINQKILFSGDPEALLTPEKILNIYSARKG
jgi:zinc transport system ATP-binding protein